MEIKIFKIPFNYKELEDIPVTKHGYIKADYFNAEECWDLCNWSC